MTWIWLRGLGRESAHWGGLPRKVEQATGDKVIALDMPGVGRKRDQRCPLRMDAVVRQLRQETAGLDNIKILAMSLGGSVALNWAASDARVKQVVLVNSSSKLSFFTKRLRFIPAVRMLSSYLSKNSHEERERKVLATLSNNSRASAQVNSLWAEVARRRPVALTQVFRQIALAGFSRLPTPSQMVHCSVQVFASRNDRLVSADCSRKLADYYQCSLVTHPEAGHELALDDPDWLLNQIKSFSVSGAITPAGC
ncbi:alpha/beta fold hydrolase [Halioxenophilus aromaticivorans]|uniref:AB hydrolase-1 domain-containing protein n=1 Tax=Halioxenophilus aromaticivorans TaxID=1306992 RepID=A0AAV3TZG3_9ALTE